MNHLSRFYRSTEGLVTVMSLYVALCAGLWASWPGVTSASAALSAPFAIFALVVGGVGLHLYAEGARRVFDAISDRFAGFFAEVMSA